MTNFEILMDAVNAAVYDECDRAIEEHGLANSDHEAYALMLEEFIETKAEFEKTEERLNAFWHCVMEDEETYPGEIMESAIMLACEAIQVAAMAMKADLSKEPEL